MAIQNQRGGGGGAASVVACYCRVDTLVRVFFFESIDDTTTTNIQYTFHAYGWQSLERKTRRRAITKKEWVQRRQGNKRLFL